MRECAHTYSNDQVPSSLVIVCATVPGSRHMTPFGTRRGNELYGSIDRYVDLCDARPSYDGVKESIHVD